MEAVSFFLAVGEVRTVKGCLRDRKEQDTGRRQYSTCGVKGRAHTSLQSRKQAAGCLVMSDEGSSSSSGDGSREGQAGELDAFPLLHVGTPKGKNRHTEHCFPT